MFTVLLADDEELIRVSIRFSINKLKPGIEIIGEASNGEDALTMTRELKPDIILTDIRMPKKDGLQMVGNLRAEGGDSEVIILSGYADFEYARQAMKYGISEYLLKPVGERALCEALSACIEKISQKRDLQQESKISKNLVTYLNAHYQEELFLDKLSEEFALSPKYLSSLVKRETGKSFSTYLTDLRMDRAMDLLIHTDLSVKEIASSVGYEDQRYFNRIFKKKTGKTPTQWRRR